MWKLGSCGGPHIVSILMIDTTCSTCQCFHRPIIAYAPNVSELVCQRDVCLPGGTVRGICPTLAPITHWFLSAEDINRVGFREWKSDRIVRVTKRTLTDLVRQLVFDMGLYHIGHKPHRSHEKTISAKRNNHIGHKKYTAI